MVIRRINAERLTALRGQRTQHDLASALRSRGFGTTQTTVSRWEAGQVPRKSVVRALADELGCKPGELVSEDDEESDLMAELAIARRIRALVREEVEAHV